MRVIKVTGTWCRMKHSLDGVIKGPYRARICRLDKGLPVRIFFDVIIDLITLTHPAVMPDFNQSRTRKTDEQTGT